MSGKDTAISGAQNREDTSGTQSIRRAVAVLRTLAMSRDAGSGLTDIARLTGQSHPTTHRILKVLISEGLVERKPATRRYALGEQVRLLALSRSRRPHLLAIAEPLLADLATSLGDTIFLTQRTGLDTICVARCLGSYPIQVASLNIGDRRPLGVSSAGIAVLAALPDGEVEDILSRNAPRLRAARSHMDQVRAMVAMARRSGYALRDQGLVPGTKAISVAISAPSGEVIAAITLAGLTRRMGTARIPALADRLASCADRIESRLASL